MAEDWWWKENDRKAKIGGHRRVSDEEAHQILSYTLLFLLFHYFLYVTDSPQCTPTDMTAHDMTTHICIHSCMTLAFASLD